MTAIDPKTIVRRLVEDDLSVADSQRRHQAANEIIAAALMIGPHTAVRHVSNILARMNATSRAEAAAYAGRLSLLSERGS